MPTTLRLLVSLLLILPTVGLAADVTSPRQMVSLTDGPWQFVGAGPKQVMPPVVAPVLPPVVGGQKQVVLPVDAPTFEGQAWETVQIPHVFMTRSQAHYNDVTQGYYRRDINIPAEDAGKRLYLVFEGASIVADVYVNGRELGQHRGAYTRFIFDATDSLHPGKSDNHLVVQVDANHNNSRDCMPDNDGLYKVWGGLYRKVWLLVVDPLHIDPTDYAGPGVYITPSNITSDSADLTAQVLVRNTTAKAQDAAVRATVLDPAGHSVATLSGNVFCPASLRGSITLHGHVPQPKLWAPGSPNLYHLRVEVAQDGTTTDAIDEPFGFRTFVFAKEGRVTLNGEPIKLAGTNLHQEIESKASAMSDDDFKTNYDFMQDMGINFIRLPHYPHAKLEYDLCDQRGLVCWAEAGQSSTHDAIGPVAEINTTEMVKQNYNHPSIAIWCVGNEASQALAESLVPLVKGLDATRPVVVANMRATNVDFRSENTYPGWYNGKQEKIWALQTKGYVSETGAGGVTTTHCDYANPQPIVDKYEPEEYQQLLVEGSLQIGVKNNDGALGIYAWWTMRDFNNHQYKSAIGWNTKGLLTYAGDKKDAYYLFRCFLRPNEPTVHITSQRYFLRMGAVDNGVKVYSSAPKLTLQLNGKVVSTLDNGQYAQNGHTVDHVFYWPVPLRTGKNEVTASDAAGHSDSATIYFYGAGGEPEPPAVNPLVTDLQTSNPANKAYFMDMPVQAQWPIYYDLDGDADNSLADLPPAIQGARWIATRRITKNGQEGDLTFKVTRPATIYVACSQETTDPAYLTDAGFKPEDAPGFVWRDNNTFLIPAQLYSRKATAGESIHIAQPDRDQIVLLKE